MSPVFSVRLKHLRDEKELTQKDIAKIIGTTDNAVGNYERGSRTPDTETLKTLADFFNVSIDYLLGRTDIRNPYVEEKHSAPTKAYHNLDASGLPEEAIKQVQDYIELIKLKYNPDGSLKKK